MSQRLIQRHVRQYASSVGLNSNDDEFANVTSYSTRVERVQKLPDARRWTLTLRKLHSLPGGKLRVEWWTEEFDAVIVGLNTDYDAPSVPSIPGLKEWAEAYPAQIQHSREYRRPEVFKGKVCPAFSICHQQASSSTIARMSLSLEARFQALASQGTLRLLRRRSPLVYGYVGSICSI